MIDLQETSFLKIENDVSFFLRQHDSKHPLFLSSLVESFYFRYLFHALLKSSSIVPLEENSLFPVLVFLRYLVRSNLCFDVAFFGSIHLKQNKLGLMYGDYYLARAGDTFQAIPNYHLLGDMLVTTLKKISASQWIYPTKRVSLSHFFKMNSLRYGSIFELCFAIPFLLNKQEFDSPGLSQKKANYLAMFCTLMKNSLLFSFLLPNRILVLNKLRNKLKE